MTSSTRRVQDQELRSKQLVLHIQSLIHLFFLHLFFTFIYSLHSLFCSLPSHFLFGSLSLFLSFIKPSTQPTPTLCAISPTQYAPLPFLVLDWFCVYRSWKRSRLEGAVTNPSDLLFCDPVLTLTQKNAIWEDATQCVETGRVGRGSVGVGGVCHF